jgi:hypothetical protein
MHREQIEIGKEELDEFKQDLNRYVNNIVPALLREVQEAGAPPIEGEQ